MRTSTSDAVYRADADGTSGDGLGNDVFGDELFSRNRREDHANIEKEVRDLSRRHELAGHGEPQAFVDQCQRFGDVDFHCFCHLIHLSLHRVCTDATTFEGATFPEPHRTRDLSVRSGAIVVCSAQSRRMQARWR